MHGAKCQPEGGGGTDQDQGDQRETREREHPLTGRDSGNASNGYTDKVLHTCNNVHMNEQ